MICNDFCMTLLEMALTEVRKLPEDKQDAIAALIIEELEDERRWDSAFASSQDKLSKLAQKARADRNAGRGREMGFDDV